MILVAVKMRGVKVNLRSSGERTFTHDRAAFFQVIYTGIYDSLLQYISEGDCVVDLGANIGCFSLLASRIVGKSGQVVAIEPEPENFDRLEQNIKLNHVDNITAVNKAIWHESGKLKTFNGYGVAGSLDNHLNTDTLTENSIQVETITLDDVYKDQGLSCVKALKVDIEGAEASILGHSSSSFAFQNTFAIAMEVHSPEILSLTRNVLTINGYEITEELVESDYIRHLAMTVALHPVLPLFLYGPQLLDLAKRCLRRSTGKGLAERTTNEFQPPTCLARKIRT